MSAWNDCGVLSCPVVERDQRRPSQEKRCHVAVADLERSRTRAAKKSSPLSRVSMAAPHEARDDSEATSMQHGFSEPLSDNDFQPTRGFTVRTGRAAK